MYAFTLERPGSVDEATKLAANPNARVLAGGQTLLASMKLRLANPEQLIDLGAIHDLAGIRREGDNLVIGAMAKHADVTSNPLVKEMIPALADLAGGIGDRQVRAMGTMGGSLANNDPSACYPAAVLALNAVVHTTERQIKADDFFKGLFATALKEGELITAVSFPKPKHAAYMKFRHPASRFALIGVFVVRTDQWVRVGVTGGGNGVFRATLIERALWKNFTPEGAAAGKVDSETLASDIHASAAYRANLISVLSQRAVAKALGQ